VKRFIFISILFCFLSAFAWSQFYKQLSQEERKELAEAYYMVGEQYKNVGKTEKGDDFIDMAFRIYPKLKSESIEPGKTPTQRKTTIVGEWQPSYSPVPKGTTAKNAIMYQFSRFLRGFFTEDKDTMLEVVDSRLFIPGIEQGLPRAEIDARIQYFFLNEGISAVPPSRIVNLQSLDFAPVERAIWKAEISVAEQPEIDLRDYLPAQNGRLTFFFRVVGDEWLIFALGSLPEQAGLIVAPEKTIRDTLVACLQAFVDGNAVKASSYFTDPFLNIPFGEEVVRDELIETFKGYFEEYDFSGLMKQRVRFDISESEQITHPGGKAYKVELEFVSEEMQEMPFWDSFSGYYVVFDERESAWKIFAIF
jgi:hypothetical protein